MFDPKGDILKKLEMEEAGRKMVMELPVIARLDGRAFHTFTRGLNRPYDRRFTLCMQETTAALIKEFHAAIGYTQSDEISLVWLKPQHFDGRYQKMCSVFASFAALAFRKALLMYLPEKAERMATFDCRVFQVENLARVKDVLEWRENDATRNSILAAGQAMFSHKELQNKNTNKVQDMLHEAGINWNDYPAFFKRGTYMRRTTVWKHLSDEQRMAIPEKHRPPVDQMVARTEVVGMGLEPLSSYTLEQFEMLLNLKDVDGD